MTEKTPENVPIPVPTPLPFRVTGWWYQEFRGPSQANATPGAPAGTSSPGGISSAQTWLTHNITPGTNSVFGMIDSAGTVRMFWYGTINLLLSEQNLAALPAQQGQANPG
jgi:hypothetical protein